MSNTVYQYRVYCETTGEHVYGWSESPTETCPANNTHTITSGSLTILNSIHSQQVEATIVEEDVPTGGHFQCKATEIHITESGAHITDLSWPFPISLLSAELLINDYEDCNDQIEAHIAPDTITGVVTSVATSGASVISVSPTVIENVAIGFYIKINSQDLGRVLDVGEDTITLEVPPTVEIAAGSYVSQTIKMMAEFDICVAGRMTLGDTKVGASYIPANTVLRYVYHSNDNVEKHFMAMIEYLY